MTTTEEQVVAKLRDKQRALVEQSTELAAERQALGYKAHACADPGSRKRLDQINAAMATHQSEMASLEAAIVEAEARLDQAHREAAIAADREKARLLEKEVQCLIDAGKGLDEHLRQVSIYSLLLEETIIKINQLGAANPSRAQLDSLGARALLTAIHKTPWTRAFELIPPRERTSFSALVEAWAGSLRNNKRRAA